MDCDCKVAKEMVRHLKKLDNLIQGGDYSSNAFRKYHLEQENKLWNLMKKSDACFAIDKIMDYVRDGNYDTAITEIDELH